MFNILYYIKKIENKWGTFKNKDHSYLNGKMSFISDKSYLNVYYSSIDKSDIKFIEKSIGRNIPDQIVEILNYTNGFRFFFSSLNLFGLQKYNQEEYEPYDIIEQNLILKSDIDFMTKKKNNYFYFGCISYELIFALDINNKVLVIDRQSGKVFDEFNSLNECFDYYFDLLYEEYDNEGKKIHINPEYADIPTLAHNTSEFKFFRRIKK